MKNKKLLVGSFVVSAVLGAIRLLITQSASTRRAASDTPYEAIDDYIEGQRRQLSIPGISLAIVEGDRIVHLRGFGRARPGGEVPTPQTPFFIGSVTKSITALAIMQLVEVGKVELDAPVQRYLPWFRVADPEASARISVRHLLNHTSGLPVLQGQMILADLDDAPEANQRQIRALSALKLSHPVGAKFGYNNTNYNILGLIIEATSGETYSDFIQNHIFDPLGMSHSYSSKSIAENNGLAMGHRYWFGYPFPETHLHIPGGSLPSGQLISCAEDMGHFLIAQLNGGRYGAAQILSSRGIDEMHRGAAEIIEFGMRLGSYAMGWESQGTGTTRIVWHSGIVPDFGACAALVPEQKKGLILLYNANHAMLKMSFDEFGLGAAKLLAGDLPSKAELGWVPWLMRGMALIPILQAADVVATLKRVNRWRADPSSVPSRRLLWGQHILLPLVLNLILSFMQVPMVSKMRGWVRLFMPDYAWIAHICGGFAGVWAFLRTRLILRSLR